MKNKIIVAVAAIAALAMIFAAVGYAAYYGTTVNTGNTVKSAYIVVGQDAYADSFDKKVEYITSTGAGNVTTYTLNTSQDGYAADINGSPAVLLGTVILTITETQNPDSSYSPFTLTMANSAALTGSYVVGVKVGDAAVAYSAFGNTAGEKTLLNNQAGAASTTVTVTLYLTVSTAGTTTVPEATPVNGVDFTFKATVSA